MMFVSHKSAPRLSFDQKVEQNGAIEADLPARFVYLYHSSFRYLLVLSLICLTISPGVTSLVYAQQAYPQLQDLFVNDYAGLLDADDAANIRTLFAELKRETGIEAVVVTIDSANDYQTDDETIESFATNLFNTWEIGDSKVNNGVLILVAVKDREVRIEVGTAYESTQNANMQAVIDEHILPSFRQGNYSRGIYHGARAVVGKLTGEWPEDLSAVQATPKPQPALAQNRSRSSDKFPFWLGFISGTFFGWFILPIWLRLLFGWNIHRTARQKSNRFDLPEPSQSSADENNRSTRRTSSPSFGFFCGGI